METISGMVLFFNGLADRQQAKSLDIQGRHQVPSLYIHHSALRRQYLRINFLSREWRREMFWMTYCFKDGCISVLTRSDPFSALAQGVTDKPPFVRQSFVADEA